MELILYMLGIIRKSYPQLIFPEITTGSWTKIILLDRASFQLLKQYGFAHRNLLDNDLQLCLFVAASHQTRLDTWSKARRPIKVGIKGRGRSGTNRDSDPAGLCCSSAHLVQCEPDEASSFTNPNVGPGTYAGLWLELDTKVKCHT